MPTKAEQLTPDSTDEQIREAISDCISQLIREGRDQQQAIAICYSQARRATGKELGRRRRRGVTITAAGPEEF